MKKHWPLIVYVLFGLIIRFWNFQHSLYFIYDQGRDALTLQKIAHLHPVLIGPTSGLSGFFLGPLWYYVNLPGYFLGAGNPYVICLWDILISSLALPMFWYLSHKLFEKRIFAVLCAVLLAIIPGSIEASIFIWNPLMSVPLMTAALLCLWKARESRVWLGLGFLCLALTLQSEFAYAVFFLPVLFLLIPWIRQKFDWKDFGVVMVAAGVTFIPQGIFELRNKFIMTTSLLRSFGDSSQSVSWSQLFAQRPMQLLSTSFDLIFGNGSSGRSPQWLMIFPVVAMAGLVICGLRKLMMARSEKKIDVTNNGRKFLWQLTFLFAFIPYPFFMLWRGNHGYFFSYYITAHFVFLVPTIMFALQELVEVASAKNLAEKFGFLKYVATAIVAFVVVSIGIASYQNWYATVFHPENNAGLFKMVQAVSQIYAWQKEDGLQQATVRTYTANVYTEQYDYLLGWYARTHHVQAPLTVQNGSEKFWYVMIESKDHVEKFFFDPWYAAATKGGVKTREMQVGVLTLETWTAAK